MDGIKKKLEPRVNKDDINVSHARDEDWEEITDVQELLESNWLMVPFTVIFCLLIMIMHFTPFFTITIPILVEWKIAFIEYVKNLHGFYRFLIILTPFWLPAFVFFGFAEYYLKRHVRIIQRKKPNNKE